MCVQKLNTSIVNTEMFFPASFTNLQGKTFRTFIYNLNCLTNQTIRNDGGERNHGKNKRAHFFIMARA